MTADAHPGPVSGGPTGRPDVCLPHAGRRDVGAPGARVSDPASPSADLPGAGALGPSPPHAGSSYTQAPDPGLPHPGQPDVGAPNTDVPDAGPSPGASARPRIRYALPSVTDLEAAYVADALKTGWGARCYEYLTRFEAAFSARLGVSRCLATSSCTGAMHLGLAALGLGPGDEVVLADANWIASVAPAVHLGAHPVFVDVDPQTWCIDADAVAAAIGPRTRAIVAVHLYGNLCDMDRLLALGQQHGIPVIEDAAEAIGSVYHGRPAGSMGRFGVFSFHGTKTMTTGEGGMLVTDDPELYERAVVLANHGRATSQLAQFRPQRVGFKFRMANLQAAMGLAQLERLDELVAAKRRVFKAYAAGLSGLPLQMNPEPEATTNGYWMPTVILDPQVARSGAQLLATLDQEGVDGRPFFPPLSSLPMFAPVPGNRHSYDLAARGLNLPSYHDLSPQDIARVCQVVRRALAVA